MRVTQLELFDQIPDELKEADLFGTTEAGETVAIPVYLHKPKIRHHGVRWFTTWIDDSEGLGMSLAEMAADKRLTVTDFRVRDYLLCKLTFENFVHVSQREASEYLGIKQPNISVSIKKLVEMNFVLMGPSKGRIKTGSSG